MTSLSSGGTMKAFFSHEGTSLHCSVPLNTKPLVFSGIHGDACTWGHLCFSAGIIINQGALWEDLEFWEKLPVAHVLGPMCVSSGAHAVVDSLCKCLDYLYLSGRSGLFSGILRCLNANSFALSGLILVWLKTRPRKNSSVFLNIFSIFIFY